MREVSSSFKTFTEFFITKDLSAMGLKYLSSFGCLDFSTGIMVKVFHISSSWSYSVHMLKSGVKTIQ